MTVDWYVQRLLRMSPAEVARRVRDALVKQGWRVTWWLRGGADPRPAAGTDAGVLTVRVPAITPAVAPEARERLIRAAEQLMAGQWDVLGAIRKDFGGQPDWFKDPLTGRRAPDRTYAFDIDHRNEAEVGNVKVIWEASRHQHLTVLAAAHFLTGDDRYAERIRRHLESWWAANPFLTGIHWTSGIELAVRLVSWVWVRRLLDGWAGVRALFEENPVFRQQLSDHQRFLAILPSHGSSANNHLIAEAAGLFASACVFQASDETTRRREWAAGTLRRELARQTFEDGLNRELATEYHAFVLELVLAAAVEGEAAGHPLGDEVWSRLRQMLDASAAILDDHGRPPRQGDADDALGLLLDHRAFDRWADLLAVGEGLFGPLGWGPKPAPGVRSAMLAAVAEAPPGLGARWTARPDVLPSAGLTFLRAPSAARGGDIWCRCDHGTLGFGSTSAHGHADLLAIELRVDGVDVLADPGTYCYHGEPAWRSYFRSTLAHNTLQVGQSDQAKQGGPFLWMSNPEAELLDASGTSSGSVGRWEARHGAYGRSGTPIVHRRAVELDRRARKLTIVDELRATSPQECTIAFHLGPGIEAELKALVAMLRWRSGGRDAAAAFRLADGFAWKLVRGSENPPLGWYSPSLHVRVPSATLVGRGVLASGQHARSVLSLSLARSGVRDASRAAASHGPEIPGQRARSEQGRPA